MAAQAGIYSSLLITSLPSIALAANFPLQDSGDHTTFLTSTGNAAYRYWDTSTAMTFQTSPDGSTAWVNTSPLSVQYVGGKVTFPSAVTGATPSARVTVGKYLPYTVLANVAEWDFDGEWQLEDTTSLVGAGGIRGRVYTPTVMKGGIKLKKWWVDELTWAVLASVTALTPLVASCVTSTGTRLEGYIYDNKMSIKAAIDKVVTEDLDFQITGPFYAV